MPDEALDDDVDRLNIDGDAVPVFTTTQTVGPSSTASGSATRSVWT